MLTTPPVQVSLLPARSGKKKRAPLIIGGVTLLALGYVAVKVL